MPTAKPRILHNYLSSDEDRATLIEGVRECMEIAAQPALRAVTTRRLRGSRRQMTTRAILAHIERNSTTLYHPVATCAMGQVVDGELRVLGIEGLRVVDASVMPTWCAGQHQRPDDHGRREGGRPDPWRALHSAIRTNSSGGDGGGSVGSSSR